MTAFRCLLMVVFLSACSGREDLSAEVGPQAISCDTTQAAVVRVDGYSIVTEGAKGLDVVSTVSWPTRTIKPGQGRARLVGDRLLLLPEDDVLEIIDVSKAPTFASGQVTLRTHGPFDIYQHILYAATSESTGGVTVVDTTDVTMPKVIRVFESSSSVFFLRVYREHLYVVTTRELLIYALNNPAIPAEVARLTSSDFGAESFSLGPFLPVEDTLFFMLQGLGGAASFEPVSLDIKNPAAPVVLQKLTEPRDSVNQCATLPLSFDGNNSAIGIGTNGIVRGRANQPSRIGWIDVSKPEAPFYQCKQAPDLTPVSIDEVTDVCHLGKTWLLLAKPLYATQDKGLPEVTLYVGRRK